MSTSLFEPRTQLNVVPVADRKQVQIFWQINPLQRRERALLQLRVPLCGWHAGYCTGYASRVAEYIADLIGSQHAGAQSQWRRKAVCPAATMRNKCAKTLRGNLQRA